MMSLQYNTSWKFLSGFVPVLFFLLISAQDSYAAGFSCNNVRQIPTIECDALVTLYNSTDGAGWVNKAGWMENNTPCSWRGVACSRGHVISLNLRGKSLSGALPSDLGDMSSLIYLWFHDNPRLVGAIPSEIGSLSQLIHLKIQNTGMYGTMPSTLTKLKRLLVLDYTNTFICTSDSDDISNWLDDIRTARGNQRVCAPVRQIKDCGNRQPITLPTEDMRYGQIAEGDGVKWTYKLDSWSDSTPIMYITVYFTCKRGNEEVILAHSTRNRYCSYQYDPTTSAGKDGEYGDKTGEGYFGFDGDMNNALTCGIGSGDISVKFIVNQALQDSSRTIPDEYYLGQNDIFDISADIIVAPGCGDSETQTILKDDNIHFSIHPQDTSGKKYSQRIEMLQNNRSHVAEFANPPLTINGRTNNHVYYNYWVKGINPNLNLAEYGETMYVNNAQSTQDLPGGNRVKFSTRSSTMEIGHSGGKNQFCGYIRNILVDPFVGVGGRH